MDTITIYLFIYFMGLACDARTWNALYLVRGGKEQETGARPAPCTQGTHTSHTLVSGIRV